MFSRKGFMGQARWAGPVYRPAAVHHRLGGMVEDYQNEINTLKEKLQRLGPGPYMQPAPVSLLPPPPPPPSSNACLSSKRCDRRLLGPWNPSTAWAAAWACSDASACRFD